MARHPALQAVVLLGTVAVLNAGCATAPGNANFVSDAFNNPNACSNNSRNLGVVLGLAAGVLAGQLIKHDTAATLIGGAVGAGLGGLIGHEMDVRRCDLYRIALANRIKIASRDVTAAELGTQTSGEKGTVGLDVQVQSDEPQFEPGTTSLTPHAQHYYGQIAHEMASPVAQGMSSTTPAPTAAPSSQSVLIVGRSAGKESVAATQERARAVAKVFEQQGVPANHIYYQGVLGGAPPPTSAAGEAASGSQIQIVALPSKNDLETYLSKRPAAPPPVAAVVAAVPAPEASAAPFDFGGKPTIDGTPIDLGPPIQEAMFGLFQTANAAVPSVYPACIKSARQVTATDVVNLATDEKLEVRRFLPDLYGEPWTGHAGMSLVAVLDGYASRDADTPSPKPELQVYAHWRTRSARNKTHARAAYMYRGDAEVYRGSSSILYRVYARAPLRCLDLVVPAAGGTAQGHLYYDEGSRIYEVTAAFTPQTHAITGSAK